MQGAERRERWRGGRNFCSPGRRRNIRRPSLGASFRVPGTGSRKPTRACRPIGLGATERRLSDLCGRVRAKRSG
jgi:hypothetical protein